LNFQFNPFSLFQSKLKDLSRKIIIYFSINFNWSQKKLPETIILTALFVFSLKSINF